MQDGSVCYYINEFNKKEMKMKKYQNPEMEVIKLNNRLALGNTAIEKYGIHLFGNDVTWSNYTGRYGENVYDEYFFIDS